jgi:hypothetical protein
MKIQCTVTLTLLAGLVIGPSAAAQGDLSTALVGTWKLIEFIRTDVASGKTTRVYGEKPVGYIMHTKGGRVLVFVAAQDRKAPAKDVPTDAERIDLFKTMYAYSGTYTVEGDKKIVYRLDASWSQSWTGTDQVRNVEMAGNRVTISSPISKAPSDGQDVIFSTTWERVD